MTQRGIWGSVRLPTLIYPIAVLRPAADCYRRLNGANLGNEPIFELAQVGGPIRPRRRLRLHPARRVVADRDADRSRHVGGDRGPAAGAARFRRRPRFGLASLYADDVFARLLDD